MRITGLLLCLFCAIPSSAADWLQFRGPNSSGVSPSTNLPHVLTPGGELWKTPLPPGHSSPIIVAGRIFLTAFDRSKIYLICLDRSTGQERWRREIPRPRKQALHKSNSPASPTPTSDGQNVYAFFVDYGLVSYTHEGKERWRVPLGPFHNPVGQGASPVLAGSILLQSCDAEAGSFFIALDKDTGKTRWRVERPESRRGFSTPILYKPEGGPMQAILAGSFQLTAYQVETGEVVWYARGLSWQAKSTPVMDSDSVYVLSESNEADPGEQAEIPSFDAALERLDWNKDRKLSRWEAALGYPGISLNWADYDLDGDGCLGDRDWRLYRSKRTGVNGLRAIKLGGSGDSSGNIRWAYSKSLPSVSSPLLYQGVLYLVKDGGIVTALDPSTGKVRKQGRLPDVHDPFFSSPVAAGGKVFMLSEGCKLAVLKAAPEWEVLAVNDFDDICHATPAIVDNTIYVRTRNALYAFGPEAAAPR